MVWLTGFGVLTNSTATGAGVGVGVGVGAGTGLISTDSRANSCVETLSGVTAASGSSSGSTLGVGLNTLAIAFLAMLTREAC